jgi:hypothetical protein
MKRYLTENPTIQLWFEHTIGDGRSHPLDSLLPSALVTMGISTSSRFKEMPFEAKAFLIALSNLSRRSSPTTGAPSRRMAEERGLVNCRAYLGRKRETEAGQ